MKVTLFKYCSCQSIISGYNHHKNYYIFPLTEPIYGFIRFIFFKKIFGFKIHYGYARPLSGILNSGNPNK